MLPEEISAIDAAIQVGFDMNLIDINLSMSVDERLRQHVMSLAVILELEAARVARDARLQPTSSKAL